MDRVHLPEGYRLTLEVHPLDMQRERHHQKESMLVSSLQPVTHPVYSGLSEDLSCSLTMSVIPSALTISTMVPWGKSSSQDTVQSASSICTLPVPPWTGVSSDTLRPTSRAVREFNNG